MIKTAPNREYHRNPWMKQMATGARPVAMCRSGAARAAMRSSTAVSAIALCALVGSTAAAATCAIDPAQGQIYIQTCIGSTGATGVIDGFRNGTEGRPGETIDSGGYGLAASYSGIPGKPTLAFTGRGGDGGVGGPAGKSTELQRGGNGGVGGNGWDLEIDLAGRVGDGGNALTPMSILSAGGAGGEGGFYGDNNNGFGGAGGSGGAGGIVTFKLNEGAEIDSAGAGVIAVSLLSQGGKGGNAQSTATNLFRAALGADGGAGGASDKISATVSGTIRSAGAGIVAISQGANGGDGGYASSAVNSATGGSGGAGGGGGAIDLTIASATVTAAGAKTPATGTTQPGQNGSITFSAPVAAVQALTFGGVGGVGGDGQGQVGKGAGGSGGSVQASSPVTITAQDSAIATSGYGAAGILAQSAGGHGGNGGFGGGTFVSKGGSGSPGGNAGTVQVVGAGGSVKTSGDSSFAIVAQSLGGGGGYGADASVIGAIFGVAVGGDSASGGDGNQAIVNNLRADESGTGPSGATIVTSGYKSAALIAQSIGGGGGIAGDARSRELGAIFSVAVGGNAGSGGNGGAVAVTNDGVAQTDGAVAFGVVAQSIGGGGGTGGAAASLAVGAQLTVSSAVGGKGGTGGAGGAASIVQSSQVVTGGADAIAILAQSIGGGGGSGGTSVARNIQLFNAPDVPSIDVTTSVGGNGGNGGTAARAGVTNDGFVMTSGAGALGVLAQSIGGGGGLGGDSDALSLLGKGATITVTTSVGGRGGSGGNAGIAAVDNSGFIGTFADHATAVMAQSVGGGGGIGGYGNSASGSQTDSKASLVATIGVGGQGGAGGNGGAVTVTNKPGAIFTQGSMSFGVFAQSVGGGGGVGGGALSNGGGGTKVNLNVAVGGGGGSGGAGAKVSVDNAGTILTAGGGASAIHAQSIGGGGGIGGDAALGTGASPATAAKDFIEQGLGIGTKTETSPDGSVVTIPDAIGESKDIYDELKKIADAYKELNPSEAGKEKGSIIGQIDADIGGGSGGKGGSAGDGGVIEITNTGSLLTRGAFAEGVFAQSIGGGGGNGGAAAVTNDTSVINGTVGVGGKGGTNGSGGAVTIGNSGAIETRADAAFGVFAQSVGGGGGKGGASVGKPGILTDFNINIGGSATARGNGGAVTVNESGSIVTAGRDAIGILGQSIGGGGGIVGLMTINADSSGGEASSKTGFIINRAAATINIGGGGGVAEGEGGVVAINLSGGSVATSGINAYGVFAQSVGGGGGLVVGVDGRSDKTSADDAFGPGPLGGNGGAINVSLRDRASISTAGAGAVGILAQSLGGGGALIGGLANVDLTISAKITTSKVISGTTFSHLGSGGDISIDVGEHTSVATTGVRAHGIFVQAAGNGGGVYSHADGSGFTMAGLSQFACGGLNEACTGNVSINVTGDVHTSGAGAHGLYVQARGNGAESRTPDTRYAVDVTLSGGEGLIRADGAGAAGIYIDSSVDKVRITNGGYLGGRSGIAIDGTGSAEIYNLVWITGDILTSGANAGYTITNYSSGRIYTGKTIMSKGTLLNQGELWLGTEAKNSTTIHSGLNSTGRLITGIDFAKGTSDILVVQGPTSISGAIFVTPLSMKSATVSFLAGNNLSVGQVTVSDFRYNYDDDTLTPVTPLLYSYSLSQTGNFLAVTMKGQLSQPDGTLGGNQDALADHLQGLFDSKANGGEAVLDALLRNVTVAEDYQPALESLGPDALGSIALLQSQADRSFTGAMMSCDGGAVQQAKAGERNCLWMRGVYGDIDRGSTASDLGYNAAFSGFQIGGQHRISDDWLIGGSLAYQRSEIDADRSRATLDGDGFDAGIFIKRETGPLLLAAALTGGRQWYDTARLTNIAGLLATAKASPNVSHIGWHARVAYELGGGKWHIRPQLDLDATRIHVGGFTEIGSPFALQVESRSETQISATPALELGGDLPLNVRLTLRPFVRAGATFNAGNDWHFVANFASVEDATQTFRSRTTLPNTVARLGAGFDLIGTRGVELKLQYDGEFGNRYAAQQGSVRLTYRF